MWVYRASTLLAWASLGHSGGVRAGKRLRGATPVYRSTMDGFKARFNSRRHCDVKVVVDGTTFYLHRFPLEAKSSFFDGQFGDSSGSDSEGSAPRALDHSHSRVSTKAGGKPVINLPKFPGGATTFEAVARYEPAWRTAWWCCWNVQRLRPHNRAVQAVACWRLLELCVTSRLLPTQRAHRTACAAER